MTEKKFHLSADKIKPLATGRGACLATDRITVDGVSVAYCYREEAGRDMDSGWRFFAGDESRDYLDDTSNTGVYDVNTITNYDPEIIPVLDAPPGAAFEKDRNGKLMAVG